MWQKMLQVGSGGGTDNSNAVGIIATSVTTDVAQTSLSYTIKEAGNYLLFNTVNEGNSGQTDTFSVNTMSGGTVIASGTENGGTSSFSWRFLKCAVGDVITAKCVGAYPSYASNASVLIRFEKPYTSIAKKSYAIGWNQTLTASVAEGDFILTYGLGNQADVEITQKSENDFRIIGGFDKNNRQIVIYCGISAVNYSLSCVGKGEYKSHTLAVFSMTK